ncbi:hypothetical protein CULC22_01014 [Corynebacterium ulcerans BR-AD22]|nr:hypothetical protein CULC22_01014 [Corynebacterium ulcerans BR-AD22]
MYEADVLFMEHMDIRQASLSFMVSMAMKKFLFRSR